MPAIAAFASAMAASSISVPPCAAPSLLDDGAGSLVTAAAVAVAGIIAFVGLVVPHMARRLVGPSHQFLLPVAMILGGVVLVAADWVSRVYLGQLEIGVITSLFGAPVFCYMLRRRMMAGR